MSHDECYLHADAFEHYCPAGTIIVFGPDGLPVPAPGAYKCRVNPKDKYWGRTPQRITAEIEHFAEELTGARALQFVEVRPLAFSKSSRCYGNCDLARQMFGARMCLGYLIWSTNDLFLTAEHHCVAQLSNGRFFDPTPDITGARKILFARSDQPATPEFIDDFLITGKTGAYKTLVDHHLIHETVKLLDEASHRLHLRTLEALQARRRVPDAEYQRWERAVEATERLLDAYYLQKHQKAAHEQRHLRRKRQKAERRAKKRNRART